MASIRQEDAANNNFSLSPSSELRSSPERPKMLAKSKNLKNEKFETAFFVVAQVQCFVLTPLSLYRKRFFFHSILCLCRNSFVYRWSDVDTHKHTVEVDWINISIESRMQAGPNDQSETKRETKNCERKSMAFIICLNVLHTFAAAVDDERRRAQENDDVDRGTNKAFVSNGK